MAGKNNLQEQDMIRLSQKLVEMTDIINKPDVDNNIGIARGSIVFKRDGQYEKVMPLTSANLGLDSIEYFKNVFDKHSMLISPLESDVHYNNNGEESGWSKYYACDFMKFVPQPLVFLLETGSLPDMWEAAELALRAYTEPVKDNELIDRSKFLSLPDIKYRKLKEMIVYSDGRSIMNRVIRFKPEFKKYLHGLPYNEFTIMMLLGRIFKVYGSCIRDIDDAIRFWELGALDAYYSLQADLAGVDCIINKVPIYTYSNTSAGVSMRKIKEEIRHCDLRPDKCIHLMKKLENKPGVHRFSDDTLKRVIDIAYSNKTGVFKIEG